MLAMGDGADCRDDVADGALLEDITEGTDVKRFIEHVLFAVDRQKDNRDSEILFLKFARHRESTKARHVDVEYCDTRPKLANLPEGFIAITGVPQNLELRLRLDSLQQPATHYRVVVGNDYSDLVTHAGCSSRSILIASVVPCPGDEWMLYVPPSIRTRSEIPIRPKPPPAELLCVP